LGDSILSSKRPAGGSNHQTAVTIEVQDMRSKAGGYPSRTQAKASSSKPKTKSNQRNIERLAHSKRLLTTSIKHKYQKMYYELIEEMLESQTNKKNQ